MQKKDPKMTNLKAGSGSTVKPLQGPRICPILGHGCWSSNRGFVDPEPSLKGLRSAERSIKKKGPRADSLQGVKCGPQTDCPAYMPDQRFGDHVFFQTIFVYIFVCLYVYMFICLYL